MSDDESSFLSRWSRLKRSARTQETAPRPTDLPTRPAPGSESDATKPEFGPAEQEAVDLESLPPVESLGPDSDFTVFLRKGVPTALKNAALRKLWASDPAIANYKTFAEYDWDFNAPGYGQLLPTDDVKKAVDALFKTIDRMAGKAPQAPAEDPAENPAADRSAEGHAVDDAASQGRIAEGGKAEDLPPPVAPTFPPMPAMVQTVPAAAPTAAVAATPEAAPVPPARRRRHGGAMPN